MKKICYGPKASDFSPQTIIVEQNDYSETIHFFAYPVNYWNEKGKKMINTAPHISS